MKKRIFIASILVSMLILARMVLGVEASPSAQVLQYSTPTPQPDGRIIYIVQENDDCLRISLLTGVSVDQLRQLNRLDEACTIIVGQEIQLGTGGPAVASPTPGPSPTPTQVLPTPTPASTGFASVCVLLYEDTNGDSLRDASELGIAGGSVSVANSAGTFSDTATTLSTLDPDTAEPQAVCFENVPEGEYTISMGVPEGYNPTTTLTYVIKVNPGDESSVSFGAQPNSVPAADTGSSGGSFPIALIGGIFLLVGGGLAWYAYSSRTSGTKMRYK